MYFILALLIALGLFFPKSKLIIVIDVVVLGLIVGLRTNSMDYYNYLLEYNMAQMVPPSLADFPGYNIIMRWSQYIGLDFTQFVLVMAFISFTLMITGMMIFSRYVPFALSLFIIYPFGHEAIQMRTFLADAIVICALPLLLIDHKTRLENILSKSMFFVIVFFASKIHTLCWFYLAIAVVYLFLRRKKCYVSLVIIITIITMLLIRLNILARVMMIISSSNKLDHWVQGSSGLGMVFYSFLTIVMYLLIRCSVLYIVKNETNVALKQIRINILNYSTCILLIIPLLIYDITFNRLWRIFLIFLYLMAGEYLYRTRFNRNKLIYIFVLLVMIISMFIIENELIVLNSLIG
ncbi:EpsG family protein [Limosilactobacillus agrestis]|uniref:EpsG family protein n=1 Tax=Limosilactobacillus agrestis TaxID=2759748 RepID=UPI001E509915|nr:EpsG family protein [Limosilactobacillus agrestis]MCD7112831.1 EpsG family protein [Limosilactobacillus agrestis]